MTLISIILTAIIFYIIGYIIGRYQEKVNLIMNIIKIKNRADIISP